MLHSHLTCPHLPVGEPQPLSQLSAVTAICFPCTQHQNRHHWKYHHSRLLSLLPTQCQPKNMHHAHKVKQAHQTSLRPPTQHNTTPQHQAHHTNSTSGAFADPRPSTELVKPLQKCCRELIEVAARHAIHLHNLQRSFGTVCFAIDYVLNSLKQPALSVDLANLIKRFACYGITQQGGRPHCIIPCNHPITGHWQGLR